MTSAEARDDLLGLIGIEDPSHASDAVLDRILADINRTLVDLYAFAPHYWGAEFAAVTTLDATPLALADKFHLAVFLPLLRANFATWKHFGEGAEAYTSQREAALQTFTALITKSETVTLSTGAFTSLQAAMDVLSFMEIETLSAASLTTRQVILRNINYVLQKLWSMLPQWWSQKSTGEMLRAPTAFSGMTVTNGSKVISGGSLASWMPGCTIRIDGDPYDNRLESTTELMRPYLGESSAAATGLVFHDAITMGTGIIGVIPPVIIQGEYELTSLRGPRDVKSFSTSGLHYPEMMGHDIEWDTFAVAEPTAIATPVGYMIEQSKSATGSTLLRLRVSPLPDQVYPITFEARLVTPRVSALDTTPIPLPQDMAESIFLPMLRWQMTAFPRFARAVQSIDLRTQHDEAFSLLVKMKPQPVIMSRIRVRPEDW